MFSQNSKEMGSTVLTVLMLISVASVGYYVSDRSLSSSEKAQKRLILNMTFNDLQKRVDATCSSIFNLKNSADKPVNNGPVTSDNILKCLTNDCIATPEDPNPIDPNEHSTGYAFNFFNHAKDTRLVGNANCPAFYSEFGAPLSKDNQLSRCSMQDSDGFAVFGSVNAFCRNGEANCKIASKFLAKCTVLKLHKGNILSSYVRTHPVSGFICPNKTGLYENAIVGINADGQFDCREMEAVVGPQGPQGVGIPGPQGPDGSVFTSVRGGGQAGCFAKGTQIATNNGTKSIEVIDSNDLIWNPKANKYFAIKKIVQGPEKKHLLEFKTATGKVKVTQLHPMKTQRGLVKANDIKSSDKLLTSNGFEKIVSITNYKNEKDPIVYNIELAADDDDNNHYLLSNGIITGDLFLQEKLGQKSTSYSEYSQSKAERINNE